MAETTRRYLGTDGQRPSALSSGPPGRLPVSMPPLRDFLTRFRPAGSPGAAAGVPADRSGELESEVAPVLALLDNTEAECERLITQARREAEQVVAAARSEAGAIAADAAQRAETAREQATRRAMTAAREQAARTTEDAGRQAAQIRELARQRMPALVSRIVGTIRQLQVEES
jgi:vacuolar-type H+-ATPase subunit H